MQQNTLTVPQRKAITDIVFGKDRWSDCLWKTAKNTYEAARNSRKLALVQESSKDVKELVDEIIKGREEVEALNAAESELMQRLNKRGFSLDSDGDLDIRSSSSLYKIIEQRLDQELGTEDEVVDSQFERAKVKIWTVATPEEADKLIEPFLNFEVKVK